MGARAGRSPERRPRSALGGFAVTSLAWCVVLLALRVYEVTLVRSSHLLPEGAATAELRGVLSDLVFALTVAALLALPVLALACWSPVAAHRLHRTALALIAMATVALTQYFAVTFVPLGADFFGYSLSDVSSTAMASKGISVAAVAALVIAGGLSWLLTGVADRIHMSRAVGSVFLATAFVTTTAAAVLMPVRQSFRSDAAWFLAQNKAFYFGARSAAHFAFSRGAGEGAFRTGYPLLHAVASDDILGPMMRTRPVPPNFVFIIVEGLGRDFVGNGARYGGFTPFLDSLTRHGLWWENFLSVSGRTFGVLPAILGSLPYGSSGFMDLRGAMPPHRTLVQLLRERGYATNFFTGTDGHFDFIDTFLDRQGIERFVDQTKFGPSYQLQPAGEGGFSWGYPDDALFRRAIELIGTGDTRPRLDIYLTITTHEPFIPPHGATYAAEFERRFASLPAGAPRRDDFRAYANVFTTLLYTDDAIRQFLAAYARRPEYGNTVFIITGDHRLVPIPAGERVDRYRVPFIVFSPMLTGPRRFASVSSHLDVTPTLIAFLRRRYGMTFPDSMAWLGTGIDTASQFRNTHAIPLMRAKNDMDEFLDGDHLLSGGTLFRANDRLGLDTVRDDVVRDSLARELDRFRAINRHVTSGPYLYPPERAAVTDAAMVAQSDTLWNTLKLGSKTPEMAFAVARDALLRKDYVTARLISVRLLRDIPNYHDARALLGRSYAWENRFDDARVILDDLALRAPDYADGQLARVDLERWAGHPAKSLTLVNQALKRFPSDPALLRARELARQALAGRSAARP